MRRLACVLASLALTGCALSHGRAIPEDATPAGPPDAGTDASTADATTLDAGPEPLETMATLELTGSWWIRDAVATADGEVCISGERRGLEGSPLLPEVGLSDAFVACFDRMGPTRVRTLPCRGASAGGGSLATNRAGDLFVELQGRCDETGILFTSVLRLDRALEVRATAVITPRDGPVTHVHALGATDEHVVVVGSAFNAATIGEHTLEGPFVAVLAADDLAPIHAVTSPPRDEEPTVDVSVGYLAVRADGVALLFGRDYEGGAFRSAGGPFVRTMQLPDGPVLAPAEDAFFHHQYAALWHPDGRPTAIGTAGAQVLRVAVGADLHTVRTGYASHPRAAFREGELLIARPMFEEGITIGERRISGERWGGFLAGFDATMFEPRWAQGLPDGYEEYIVVVLPDDTMAVVGCRADDDAPGMHLAFYR